MRRDIRCSETQSLGQRWGLSKLARWAASPYKAALSLLARASLRRRAEEMRERSCSVSSGESSRRSKERRGPWRTGRTSADRTKPLAMSQQIPSPPTSLRRPWFRWKCPLAVRWVVEYESVRTANRRSNRLPAWRLQRRRKCKFARTTQVVTDSDR
jgi:hypothetical protein